MVTTFLYFLNDPYHSCGALQLILYHFFQKTNQIGRYSWLESELFTGINNEWRQNAEVEIFRRWKGKEFWWRPAQTNEWRQFFCMYIHIVLSVHHMVYVVAWKIHENITNKWNLLYSINSISRRIVIAPVQKNGHFELCRQEKVMPANDRARARAEYRAATVDPWTDRRARRTVQFHRRLRRLRLSGAPLKDPLSPLPAPSSTLLPSHRG